MFVEGSCESAEGPAATGPAVMGGVVRARAGGPAHGVAGRIAQLGAELARELAAIDVESLPPLEAQALVPELAAIERRAAAATVLAAARAAASTRREEGGDRRAAEWLAERTHRSRRQSERAFALADALRSDSPAGRAWRDGRLTADQAELVAEAIEAAPGREAELVDLADRAPVEDLRKAVRRIVREARQETAEERQARHHARRHLGTWTDDDDAFVGRFCTTVVQGAGIKAVLDLCCDAVFRRSRRLGEQASIAAHRMDALELMAQLAAGEDPLDLGFVLADLPAPLRPLLDDEDADLDDLDGVEFDDGSQGHVDGAAAHHDTDRQDRGDGTTGTRPAAGEASAPRQPARPDEPAATSADGRARSRDAAPTDDQREPEPDVPPSGRSDEASGPERKRRKARYRPRGPKAGGVVAVVDFAALCRGHALPGERCEIPGIGPVPVAAARELLGEGALRLVLTDGVDVRTVAHTRRRPSAHQLTALLARYDECCVAGCSSRVALQDDHDDPWARTHQTWLPNLKRVCPHHHARKTHKGWDWVVEEPDPTTGKHRLVPPDHPDHPARAGARKPRPPTRRAA